MKKVFQWIILLFVPIVATLMICLVGEGYFTFRYKNIKLYQFDPKVGWVPKNNFFYDRNAFDNAGNEYLVSLSTNKYGFREWGNINTDNTKILFIGDSFTGDANMSDEDAYYGQVKQFINAEIFAYGGGGYGSLQELMILNKYKNIINPDYFVLQFCSNDFVNNSFDLEGRSIVRNQKNIRPYLQDDRIVYRDNKIYSFLYRNSNFFTFLDNKLQRIQFKIYGSSTPPYKEEDMKKIKEEETEAVQITGRLLKMMADSLPERTRLLTFNCKTEDKEKTNHWIRLSKKSGFIPLPIVSEAVEQAEKEGIVVRAADGGHWNPQGHHIAGKVLVKELKRIMNVSTNQN
jgi:lysophospholipase L1-like esterase